MFLRVRIHRPYNNLSCYVEDFGVDGKPVFDAHALGAASAWTYPGRDEDDRKAIVASIRPCWTPRQVRTAGNSRDKIGSFMMLD
jgi:hypothetical protein